MCMYIYTYIYIYILRHISGSRCTILIGAPICSQSDHSVAGRATETPVPSSHGALPRIAGRTKLVSNKTLTWIFFPRGHANTIHVLGVAPMGIAIYSWTNCWHSSSPSGALPYFEKPDRAGRYRSPSILAASNLCQDR